MNAQLWQIFYAHTTELQELNLCNNDIDDEGVDILVGALANSRLSSLDLSSNRNITARGCQSLAALLENPNSNLEELYLSITTLVMKGHLFLQMHWPATAN